MENESSLPILSTAVVVVGIVILLYGVILDSGMEMNPPMAAGGVVMLIGMGILGFHLGSLEKEGEEHI